MCIIKIIYTQGPTLPVGLNKILGEEKSYTDAFDSLHVGQSWTYFNGLTIMVFVLFGIDSTGIYARACSINS